MARNDRVRGLRATAKRMERNAGRKMSRLRGAGIELSGTQFDVRRGAGDISKMRSRDLETHIRRLGEFNSRKARFMQTDQGPITGDVVNRFISAQTRVNNKRQAKLDMYGGVKSPISDENMSQRWAVREQAQRRMNDPAENNIFRPLDKKGIHWRLPESIIKMTEHLEKQLEPEYEGERRNKNRDTLDKILDRIGETELDGIISSLTDEQFDLLWYNPDFMAGAGFVYAQVVHRDKDNMESHQIEAMESMIENEIGEAITIAKWAAGN